MQHYKEKVYFEFLNDSKVFIYFDFKLFGPRVLTGFK